MGKYTDQLNNLRERRCFMQSNYRRLMDAYGGIMDEKYKCLNEAHYKIALEHEEGYQFYADDCDAV